MNASIFYSDFAEKDILSALTYYRGESETLGEYFLNSLKDAENVIIKNPEGFQVRYFDRIRAYPLKKFPFLILYIYVKDSVFVLAVFNTNQNSERISERLSQE